MAIENLTAENLVVENTLENVAAPDAQTPAPIPAHRFNYREGNLYGYLGAVSEEQKKQGAAAPSVVMFRYERYWDGENHLDLMSDDANAVVERAECPVPCVVIKETFADGSMKRVGYTPDSIIGSAFLDAMNAQLQRSPRVGEVKGGYRFLGGDPMDASNWRSLAATPPPAASGADSDEQGRTAENPMVEKTN